MSRADGSDIRPFSYLSGIRPDIRLPRYTRLATRYPTGYFTSELMLSVFHLYEYLCLYKIVMHQAIRTCEGDQVLFENTFKVEGAVNGEKIP